MLSPAGLGRLDDGPGQQCRASRSTPPSPACRAAGRAGRGTRARTHAAIAMATSATGTIARKTLRQAKCVEQPAADDRSGGDADAGAAPQTPRAAARSRRSVNALAMIDSVAGKITAAQAPSEPGGDQRAGGSRRGRSRARHGEAQQAEDQRGTAPEPVGQAAGGEHQRREGQVVAVDEPQELAGAGVELHARASGSAMLTIVVSRLIASTAAQTVARIAGLSIAWGRTLQTASLMWAVSTSGWIT